MMKATSDASIRRSCPKKGIRWSLRLPPPRRWRSSPKSDYDLVVLDIKLKNESGLDLLQKIVKERHDMPVILCTAFSCYKDDFSTWLADGYVVKSSDTQELKDEIKRVLAKKSR